MWTGSVMVTVVSDFVQIDGIERGGEVDLGGGVEEE